MEFGESGFKWTSDYEDGYSLSVNCAGRYLRIESTVHCCDDSRSGETIYECRTKDAILDAEYALERALEEIEDMTKGGVYIRQNKCWYWRPNHKGNCLMDNETF